MIISKPERYSQDETGQWWYTAANGQRKRCEPRACPQCGETFVSANRQVCCSHKCGAAHMHQQRPVTTADVTPDGIVNANNPRYSRDESGQWWYTPGGPKKHGRTRAHIKTCAECGRPFLACVFHKAIEHCSQTCAQRARARANPGRYGGKWAGNWKGGKVIRRGYVWVWDPEAAQRMRPGTKKPYVLEHRLVMEKRIGRPLLPGESVHHKDGRTTNNDPKNLELWTKKHLAGQRVKDLIAFARWVLATYGPVEDKVA